MGYKWNDAEDLVTFFIDSDIIEDAMDSWNDAGCDAASFERGGFPHAHEVGVAEVSYWWVSWDGQSTIYRLIWNPSVIVEVMIKINTYYTDNYETDAAQSVVCHEFGHAFGLDHETGAVVMNAYTFGTGSRYGGYGIYEPEDDDVDGVNAMY